MRSGGRKKASEESAKVAESSEITLDLGREASESYQAIIKSKPKRAMPAVSSPPSKVHVSSDGEQPMLPDYPVNTDFDSRVLARSRTAVDKAFESNFGWRAAFEEACRLELQRAKTIYGSGNGKPLLEQMEKLATLLL
jgi:hypothetical protein